MSERTERRSVWLPIANATWPMLTARFPMSEAEWDQMITTLEAMRPGLVIGDAGKQQQPEADLIETRLCSPCLAAHRAETDQPQPGADRE